MKDLIRRDATISNCPHFVVRDRREGGWFWANNELIDVYAHQVGLEGIALYMYLSRHAWNATEQCTMKQTDIAEAFGVDRKRIQRHLPRLISAGLIAIEHGSRSDAATYILLDVPKQGIVAKSQNRTSNKTGHPEATKKGIRKSQNRRCNKEARLRQDSQDSSSTEKVPAELAEGLRTIIPTMDDAAIERIWKDCKESVPDCTAEEILHFALSKKPSLEGKRSPVGFLIRAIAIACTPATVDALREELRQAELTRQAAAERGAAKQRAHEAWLYEQARKQDEALAALQAMDPGERERRRAAIGNAMVRLYHQARSWPNFAELVERGLLRELMGEHTEFPSVATGDELRKSAALKKAI